MKNTKIKLILFFTISAFYLSNCSDKDSPTPASSIRGTWKVESYENHVTHSSTVKTDDNSNGLDVILTFDDSSQPHEIKGKNTTNSIIGTFIYSNTNEISIIELGGTKIAQPEWGNLFTEAYQKGLKEFKITGNKLIIYYDNKNRHIVFVREG